MNTPRSLLRNRLLGASRNTLPPLGGGGSVLRDAPERRLRSRIFADDYAKSRRIMQRPVTSFFQLESERNEELMYSRRIS